MTISIPYKTREDGDYWEEKSQAYFEEVEDEIIEVLVEGERIRFNKQDLIKLLKALT